MSVYKVYTLNLSHFSKFKIFYQTNTKFCRHQQPAPGPQTLGQQLVQSSHPNLCKTVPNAGPWSVISPLGVTPSAKRWPDYLQHLWYMVIVWAKPALLTWGFISQPLI